jgi:hypothetical protein
MRLRPAALFRPTRRRARKVMMSPVGHRHLSDKFGLKLNTAFLKGNPPNAMCPGQLQKICIVSGQIGLSTLWHKSHAA